MCKPAHIGKRLNCTGAQIEQRPGIGLGADLGFGFLRVEQLHIGTAPRPLFIAVFKFLETLLANSAMQRTLLFNFAGNLVFLDDFKNQLRRIAEHIEQTVAILLTKHARQIIRHDPHARIDEAHIAARAAVADFNAFQHDGVGAFFSQMQSRRKAGKSAAHNHHIGRQIAFQRCGLRCGWSGLLPKTMRARIVQH